MMICSKNTSLNHLNFRFSENSYLSLPTLPRAYLAFDLEISFKPETGDGKCSVVYMERGKLVLCV